MGKPKIEQRWGWLASLIAGLIVTCFRIFETYLQFCFSCLEAGPQGFLFLIGLHIAAPIALLIM